MTHPQLTYYALGDDVVAFSTTRKGGVSVGSYASFNINPYCGDSAQAVTANLQALARKLHIPVSHIVMPHQVHGIVARVVDGHFLSQDKERQVAQLEGVDALLTRERGLCIGVSTADCIPILLHDPDHHAVAAIHAGWRGTVRRIARHAVEDMQRTFDTRPARLHAVIGPGISLRHFEVGDEVYRQFRSAGFDMAAIAMHRDKWHIDLPACNRQQLMEAGLSPTAITLTGICTYEQVADYFSARRLGTESGRIFTGIMLT